MEPKNGKIILESKRLFFRLHTPDDMDDFCAMEQDPEVRRYVGGKPRTRVEAEDRFVNGPMQPHDGFWAMWATILKADNQYVGRCGLYPHYNEAGKIIEGDASMGLYIAHKYWRKGFATEAGRALIRFGFNTHHLKRIVTMIEVGNDASVHIIEKLGFTLSQTEHGGYRSFYHYVLENPVYN
ncbi:GNAT family N-acetyltransferase [Mucilaginibacter lappiensis]|uniref:RimJ/RimL family protein N-acetyltransferase n=1 Tax=Mucilaginibacter lappiensis TaxID=354630 RepID=A0A1N7GCV7_9SPHI|nr:GNAT family N-acetyltransferase [Mucilaginibacter lappiensis]MBB6112986.1 RimJ/RimL family protein N-acetyltransferase [Mucilaginibacter lappiensis]MBB6127466.1 RimJ/RimL family protein N-acetyltransferase [Mucilaginibacter lappiensis]SIS10356.1 Protein N-acetyltransferase, RimJ/RimL family [Mucilaginibacter lappiensis]